MMPAARGPRFGFVIARAGSHIHFRRNRHRVSAAGLDLLIERTSVQLRQISGVADAGIKPGVVASRVAAELLARGEPSLSQLLDSAEGGDADLDAAFVDLVDDVGMQECEQRLTVAGVESLVILLDERVHGFR